MIILFYDAATPTVYTRATLNERALGGTEATVARVAEGLAPLHTIYLAQHNRSKKEECEEKNVRYISFDTAHQLTPDAVILLRQTQLLEEIGKYYPTAKLFFWMHNLPSKKFFYLKKIKKFLLIGLKVTWNYFLIILKFSYYLNILFN